MRTKTKRAVNYILSRHRSMSQGISLMRLQKVLYLAHGWTLAVTDTPLIEDHIEAWKYGPVVPFVYAEFKRYGNNPIEHLVASMSPDRELFFPNLTADASVEVVDKVMVVYGGSSTQELSVIARLPFSPWHQTYHKGPNAIIEPDLIRQWFCKVAGDG